MPAIANDPRSTSELLHVALKYDGDTAWDAVSALHWRGTKEILVKCLALSQSKHPEERVLAADILGQLGVPNRTFPDESFDILLRLLSDVDSKVVFSAIMGIQHVDRARAAPYVRPYATSQDGNIRYAVAAALGGVENEDATATLLMLMEDQNAEVRDLATFGIGQLSEADSEKIRSALARRLRDKDSDVRYEAAIGLGLRRDARSVSLLTAILQDDPSDIFAREAAMRLAGIDDREEPDTANILRALKALH